MSKLTPADIVECLELISGAIPKFVMNASTPDTYFDLLKDLSRDELMAATRSYLSERNEYTPVPTPGILREKALDLHLLALGVPTSGEAWGKVMDSQKRALTGFCALGGDLRTKADQAGPDSYWSAVWEYKKHTDQCPTCNPQPGKVEDYGHPVIAEAVRLLGGRDAILTDNPVADRARFIPAYQEIVMRERNRINQPQEVRDFIEKRTAQLDSGVDPVYLIGNGVEDVVDRMSRRTRKDLE